MPALRHGAAAWLVLIILAFPAMADKLPAETRWADPSSVKLNVEFPGQGYHASWDLFRCDCGDLLVRAELSVPGVVETGDILLVKGEAVLTRGFGEYKDEASASLDAAALMMQMALRLLERSAPAGPSSIDGAVDVDLVDKINHIYLDTGYAEGVFQAPWSVSGKIAEAGDTRRNFDLRFSFAVNDSGVVQQASMRLKGSAEFAATDFPVSASSDLAEWDLDWRNKSDAMPVTGTTLGELRAQIQARARTR